MVFEKTPGGFAVTIAERGRGDESVSTAEVFTWSELPELLAAEDLFEGAGASGALEVRNARVGVLARVDDDEDDDFEDEDDDFEDDDDEEYEDDDESEEEEEEDGEEWEEVDDEDEDEDDEDEEEGDDFEEEDEDWEEEDDDEDWDDDEDD